MPQSPEEMAASMKANIEEKTGKSIAEWLKVLAATELQKHGQVVEHLKSAHGVSHGYASMIAHEHLGSAPGHSAGDDLVAAQYAGKKEGLKPIYDAVLAVAQGFGGDVEVAPKKTSVSLRRAKQFAVVKPATQTRIDLGVNLKGEPASGRLKEITSSSAMCSHQVALTSVDDVDREVKGWLKKAYEAADKR